MNKVFKLPFFYMSLLTLLTCSSFSFAHYDIFPPIFHEAAFFVKLEKLVQKLLKQKNKENIDRMIDIMLDIKLEVESETEKQINIQYFLDQVKDSLKKKGCQLPENEWENFRKKLAQRDQRKRSYMEYLELNFYDPELDFITEYKQSHSKNEKTEILVVLPAKVIYGINVALSGELICLLSQPQAKFRGKHLIKTGISAAVEASKK